MTPEIVVLAVPPMVSWLPPVVRALTTVKRLDELFVQLCAPPRVMGAAFVALPMVTAPAPELIVMPPVPIVRACAVALVELMSVVPVLAKVRPAMPVAALRLTVSAPFTAEPLNTALSVESGTTLPAGLPVGLMDQFAPVCQVPLAKSQ